MKGMKPFRSLLLHTSPPGNKKSMTCGKHGQRGDTCNAGSSENQRLQAFGRSVPQKCIKGMGGAWLGAKPVQFLA